MDASCQVCNKNTGYLLLKGGAYFHARCFRRTHPLDELEESVNRDWNKAARASMDAIIAKYGTGRLITSASLKKEPKT